MKPYYSLGIGLIALLPAFVSTHADVSRKIDTTPFSSIVVDGNCDIKYTADARQDSPLISIVAPDSETLDAVVITSDNGVLRISEKDGIDATATIKITGSNLEGITLNGSGDFKATNEILITTFRITLNGSGDANLPAIDARDVRISSNGSGDLAIGQIRANGLDIASHSSGDLLIDTADVSDFSLTGDSSGDTSIRTLLTTDCRLKSSGSGDTTIDTIDTDKADIRSNGSGDMSVDNLTASKVTVACDGSSEILLDNIKAKTVNATNNGSGSIFLAGSVSRAQLTLNGPGKIEASGLSADNIETQNSGNGYIRVSR